MLHCGIVGLPLSGKTTVFNVITRAGAEVKPYAGGKTDPNRAVVSVPDERFDRLAEFWKPKKVTPAQIEFVDLAGLSRDASKGGGLGNAFLSFAAEAEALVHVLRAFENPAVEHPEGSVDPVRDLEIVDLELIYRDLGVAENRIARLAAKKRLLPEEETERALLVRCRDLLLEERPLRELEMNPEERRLSRGFTFVTAKPQILVLNCGEERTDPEAVPGYGAIARIAAERGLPLLLLWGRTEMDLLDLSPEEGTEFAAELGVPLGGRDRLIAQAYRLLGLISFFTCGPDEVRAWTLRSGGTAVEAAGTIHSDLARGFIRAQVVAYSDYEAQEFSFARCRDAGILRLEGKDYPVADGDVIEIRFNV